jgi:Rad3-related DNA helicase
VDRYYQLNKLANNSMDIINVNQRYIDPFSFDVNDKIIDALVVRSNMGTGKTVRLIEYVINLLQKNMDSRIVVLSTRKSYTDEILQKLNDGINKYNKKLYDINPESALIDVQFESYQDIQGQIT